jgi:uncharacterized protein (UPF0335 family)
MTDAKLKSLVERINRLIDERDGVSADIRDIYAEAKGNGYIPKALRKVVARLRADPAKLAEEDALQETYEAALGRVGKAMRAVREGATLDAAAEANGIDRATLARARAVAKQSENATVAKPPEIATPVEQGDRQSPLRDGGAPVETSTVGPAVTTLADEAERLGLTGVVRIMEARREAEDDLAFPPGLDRRHERVRG